MLTFFHGWRRKLACLTLVAACLLLAAWVRSMSGIDILSFQMQDGAYCTLSSCCSSITWATEGDDLSDPEQIVARPRWLRREFNGFVVNGDAATDDTPGGRQWRRRFSGVWEFEPGKNGHITIPYWSIVLLLSAPSAWLLLSKPRKKPDVPTVPQA